MRNLFLGLLVLAITACGSSSQQKKKEIPSPELSEYYFDQQVGGTAEAGINETYYFKVKDDLAIIESIKVREEQIEMESRDGVLFHGTSSMMSGDEVDNSKFRKVEVFARLREGEGAVHWQLDSVPLREQIFMPSAMPVQER